MARSGVTVDQVTAAAVAIELRGENVTIEAVRTYLKTGSPNTIHRHLRQWKNNRPKRQGVQADYQLPAAIVSMFAKEIARVSDECRDSMSVELQEAKAEANQLAELGEQIEIERDEMVAQNEKLSGERDEQRGKVSALAAQVAELVIERDRYHATSQAARSELAALKVVCEHQAEKLTELDELRDMVNILRERITDYKVELAVAHSKLEGLKKTSTNNSQSGKRQNKSGELPKD